MSKNINLKINYYKYFDYFLIGHFLYTIEIIKLLLFYPKTVKVGKNNRKLVKAIFNIINKKYKKIYCDISESSHLFRYLKIPILLNIKNNKTLIPTDNQDYQNIMWTLIFTKKIIKKQKHIGLLIEPNIVNINEKKGIAGTESIFINDIKMLSKNHTVIAAAAFKNKNIQKIRTSRLILFFIDKFRTNLFLSNIFLFLNYSFYSICFLIILYKKKLNYKKLITYSFPFFSIFFPKKTIVMMHYLAPLDFYKIFKTRYQKTNFVFCSKNLRKQFINKYPEINPKKITVLYNGIDIKLFKPYQKKTSSKKTTFLYASAWTKEKGLNIVLKIFNNLTIKEKSKSRLTIASNENLWSQSTYTKNEKKYLEQSKKIISNTSNIITLGGIPRYKMPQIYSSHDYLLIPSIWKEPFGLVALESIACGTPVIYFDSGGITEILDKNNSIIIKNNYKKNLNIIIKKIIRNNYPIKRKTKKSLLSKKNIPMLKKIRSLYYIKLISKK